MPYFNNYASSVVSDVGGTLVTSNKVLYALVQRGNQMFALGGTNQGGSGNTSNIDMTTYVDGGLSNSGGLNGWETIGNLPALVSLHAAAMVGDWIYVVGGKTGSGAGSTSNQVVSVRVESNGTVSDIYTETAFPVTIDSHTMFAYNNRLYVLGGSQAGSASSACWVSDIGGNGRPVGNWTVTTPLPATLTLHASAVTYNGVVMVTGGNDGTNNVATVYTTVVQSNGQLGSWSTQTPMISARVNHTLTNSGNGMYAMGGSDNTPTVLNSFEFCDVDLQGRVGQNGWSQGSSSVSYSLLVGSTTGGDGVTFTSNIVGNGTGISVTYNSPSGGTTTVAVSGQAITVSPKASATNNDIVTAIRASAAASALVNVVATGGTDLVVAASVANLAATITPNTTLVSTTAEHQAALVDNGEKIYLIGGRNQATTDLVTPQVFKRY